MFDINQNKWRYLPMNKNIQQYVLLHTPAFTDKAQAIVLD